MSRSHRQTTERLPNEDVEILMTLWENLHRLVPLGDMMPSGLSRQDLESTLVPKPFHSKNTLFSHLTQLGQYANLLKTETIRATGETHKGNHRHLYSLAEGKAITSPATALIAMSVWNAAGHRADEDGLIKYLATMELRNQPTDIPYSEMMIAAKIRFLFENQYISRTEGAGEIWVADRFRVEVDYVFRVALKCLVGTPPMTLENRSAAERH